MSLPTISTRLHAAVSPEFAFDELIDVRTGVFSRLTVHSGIEQTPAGPIEAGTEFHVSRHRRPWMVIRVREATRPKHFTTESTLGSFWPGLVRYTFEPSGDGTSVEIESSGAPIRRWWLRPLGSLYVWAMRPWLVRKARANAAVLAHDLEERPQPASRDSA